MRVWLISAFEPIPTDNIRPMRFMGLARELVNKGHEVVFWTSSFSHFKKTQRFDRDQEIEITPGYVVRVVYSRGYKRDISIGRVFAHADFADKLFDNLTKEESPDLIYLSFPPISTLNRIRKYAEKHQVKYVVDIIDPWPDVFLKVFHKKIRFLIKVPFRFYYRILRKAFSSAAAVVSISSEYLRWSERFRATAKNSASEVFYPSVDVALYDQFRNNAKSISDSISLVYAGTIGRFYDIDTIIQSARALDKMDLPIQFKIIGSGPLEQYYRESASDLQNITFYGWMDQEALLAELCASDIGIASYTKDSTQTVTYKLFDYLAAGLPLLCSLNGEMREVIESKQIGFYYEAGNSEMLLHRILHLHRSEALRAKMKKSAVQYAKAYGDNSVVYARLVKFLEEVKSTHI